MNFDEEMDERIVNAEPRRSNDEKINIM